MNKTKVMITAILIPVLLSTSCSAELFPKALAADTQRIVEDVRQDNDDVFKEIQRNINLVTELKAKVQEAQISGQAISLNEVIRDIEKIATSYEKLAGQKEEIRKEILKRVADLDKMHSLVDAEIEALNQRKTEYLGQLRLLDTTNPEIYRTRQKALSQAVDYVDQQIALWVKFNEIEDGIIIEMTDIQETIDSFLSMIESSAIVFREGWNLLVLVRDINNALSLFNEDLPRIQQLTSDMEKSWGNLDYLVNNLVSISTVGIAK